MAASEVRFRKTRDKDVNFLTENGNKEGVIQTDTGLQYKVLKAAPDQSKPTPSMSTPCQIHYRGRLVDGTEFDSSYKRGKPAIFQPDQVVPGWTQAMKLMRDGDKFEIYVPADLGYGERGAGPIPGGAALIFEMEMLKVNAKEEGGFFGSFGPMQKIVGLLAIGLIWYVITQANPGASANGKGFIKPEDASSPDNPRVFFDITVGGESAGRIEFELFANFVPRTAENFRALSTGEMGDGKSGKKLHYKGSNVHRVIPNFMCQGGDITHGTGTGGESIYGGSFEDEWQNGIITHTQPFLLSMANRGKNTGSSQFFITTAKTTWLDSKHVVFGRVVSGEEVVRKMEAVGSKSGTPSQKVIVEDCGELTTGSG